MADAGSSGAQHTPAAWQAQAAPGRVSPGPSAQSAESDDEKDGPEPVEYSPGGRYGRMDLVLGRGAFKTVYKAFDEEEGTEVAWNQVRVVELVNSKEERDRLFAEIRVLKQLKHKNIMSFHDSWLDQKTMCVNFITELFTSGTLRQYRKRHRQIDEEVLKRWAWQILCGLVYLHGHTPPIIHRDLKCDNIFINGSQGIVKIGDLGLATLLRARTAPQSVLGTPEFMAPELYEEEYDDRVDVYSYGMCLLELATMEYPYAECRNAAQIYRKVYLGVRPAGLGRVPSRELAEFIAVCIRTKDERPRSRQLLKHPYFDSIRERAAARAEALSATASQVDMFSDYASVSSSSGHGSDVSRSSSVAGGADSSGLADAAGSAPGGESDDSLAPLPEPAAVPPAEIARSRPRPIASGRRSQPGERELTGSLQSAVESLHTIAESLPGLLAEGSPSAARAALMAASQQEDGTHGQAHPDRKFRVRGKLQPDMEKLNLRLRILEPEAPAKTVDFDFDLGADTAMSVASEMVEDLSLSAEDARAVAAAIRDEIKLLTGLLNRHANDSLASSSNGDVREGSTSSADKERQPGGEHAEELQHPFDADDADLAPPAVRTGQPPPAGDRIQSSEHPFEPGGQSSFAAAAGIRSSFSGASGNQGRVSFDESCSQPASGERQAAAGSSPAGGSSPMSPLQQHHGQSLDSVPALRGPSGATALSADAAAAMAAASGDLRGESTLTPMSSPPPGSSPRGAAPQHHPSPAQSVDETMGVRAAGGGKRSGGATPGSDGGSAMSLDALDSHAPDGGVGSPLEQGHSTLTVDVTDGGEQHHHLAQPGLVHSGSAKTLRGLDSEQLSTQLGLIGVKRAPSGVLSPQPRPPERKVPLGKLFEDAGHITAVPQRRNGLHHTASLPVTGFAGEGVVAGCSPQRSAGNSFDSSLVRSAPASESGSGKQQGIGRPPLGHGHAPSAAAASTQTQHSSGPHAARGSVSGGDRPPQSTATSLPAAVAGSLASLTQRLGY